MRPNGSSNQEGATESCIENIQFWWIQNRDHSNNKTSYRDIRIVNNGCIFYSIMENYRMQTLIFVYRVYGTSLFSTMAEKCPLNTETITNPLNIPVRNLSTFWLCLHLKSGQLCITRRQLFEQKLQFSHVSVVLMTT